MGLLYLIVHQLVKILYYEDARYVGENHLDIVP